MGGGRTAGRFLLAHHKRQWRQEEKDIRNQPEVIDEGQYRRLFLHLLVNHAQERRTPMPCDSGKLPGRRRIGVLPNAEAERIDLCGQVVRRASKKVRIACNVKALHDVPPRDNQKDDSLLQADRIIGTAVFLGKYYGFWAGMKFRISATLGSVFFFRWGMAKYLLSNQKLDGTH